MFAVAGVARVFCFGRASNGRYPARRHYDVGGETSLASYTEQHPPRAVLHSPYT